MNLPTATIDPGEAAEQLADYRTLRAPSDEERAVIATLVAAVAGKALVNLPDAIREGGSFDDGCPRLAVMTPSQSWCYVQRSGNGEVVYRGLPTTRAAALRFRVDGFPAMPGPALTAADLTSWWGAVRRTQVPIVPPRCRVRGWRTRCVVLWEVEEWARHTTPRPPGDPALLRHLTGDLYSVEAVWDLTPLEQLVIGARV